MYCWQYSMVCSDNVWSSTHKTSPIISKAKPKLMKLWSFFLVILGKHPAKKHPKKVCPSDMNHQASVLVRRPVAGCSSLRFFNERLATENAHVSHESVGDIGISVVLVWRHWLWYHYDNHMYHDSINDNFKSRIILVLTCSRGTSRLSHLTLGWKLKCEAVIRSSGRGRQ